MATLTIFPAFGTPPINLIVLFPSVSIIKSLSDIYLSTFGHVAGAGYTIIVEGKKTAGFTSRETTDDGESP